MHLPRPVPGLVLRYGFLWSREAAAGGEEARKDRPCCIVLAAPVSEGDVRVYVLPVTHAAPTDPESAIAMPAQIKRHLDLDDAPSWIVIAEVNDFLWPGYDIRPIPGVQPPRPDYGVLPPRFFQQVRNAFVTIARRRRIARTSRT